MHNPGPRVALHRSLFCPKVALHRSLFFLDPNPIVQMTLSGSPKVLRWRRGVSWDPAVSCDIDSSTPSWFKLRLTGAPRLLHPILSSIREPSEEESHRKNGPEPWGRSQLLCRNCIPGTTSRGQQASWAARSHRKDTRLNHWKGSVSPASLLGVLYFQPLSEIWVTYQFCPLIRWTESRVVMQSV